MRTVRRVAGAVAVAAATCVVAGGCSVDLWAAPTVAESGLERSVQDELENKSLPVRDVDCPDNLRGKEDETMSCTVSADEGEYDVTLTVTEIDGSTVRYDIDADAAPSTKDGSGGEPTGDGSQSSERPRAIQPQGQPTPSEPSQPAEPDAPDEAGDPNASEGATIAAEELQRSVETDIRNRLGGTVAVVCPDDVEARVGARTRCGASDGTTTLTLDVTVMRLDDSGDFQVSYTPSEGRFPSEQAPTGPGQRDEPGDEPGGPFETV